MEYGAVKVVHMTCALVSYVLFVLRGLWRFTDSPLAGQRWTRIVPHVNDTLLLAAALTLAWRLVPFPAFHDFLAAKVLGLVTYILLGMLAFRWAATRRMQVVAWLTAQLVFFYIVAVAISKRPWPGIGATS
ncbi:MAG: SirB2 family protein [Burkholderiales bacterium]